MLNDLKRTILSIKEHKKDSILIFLIILILTTFMMVYHLFYLSANKMSQTIKDNVKINIELDGGFLQETKSDDLSLYLEQNTLNYNFYLNHIKRLQKIFDTSTTYDKVSSTSSLLYLSIENNLNSYYKYVYSFNSDAFINDNYQILEGKMLDENNNGILINRVVTIENEDGTYTEPKLGDIVTFTNSNGNTFSYEIIGIFDYTNNGQVLTNDLMYDKTQTSFILPLQQLYEMTTLTNILYIKNPTIKIVGIDNANSLYKYINKELSYLKFIKDDTIAQKSDVPLQGYQNYSVSIDDTMAKQLEKPIDNIKILFQIISIFMIVIMFILLSSFILCVLNSRIHDFGIFIALGQSKLKTIINFLREIFIIAIVSFILSIPITNKLTNIISNSLINSNLKRQERIAIISNNQDDIDIFKSTKEAYKDYNLTLNTNDYLYVFSLTSLIILISQTSVLIIVTSIKPKQLLIK